ncbi:GMP synthase-Glutamine amidotransferase [Pedobacter suwonensis]|uniref:GMP synthase-Glutamine amidotransferase n=1 Tax=Pedobacter suwonensis TaxID=332999 RepID=A0A1I0TI96_9SPHI|nr:GMP synthase [Pedobacter suwonensis]SFA51490.1 GMP synthase-Glutamine amidotransferase [Pedobacter suwonensis]
MDKRSLRVAVIDMNNGAPNQGIRGIQEILSRFKKDNDIDLSFDIFDLRQKGEIPGIDYDAYISSGGPGSPTESKGEKWENVFFDLLDQIEAFNQAHEEKKKFAFLICHSFQLACRKYNLGNVTERRSNAFGIFPVTLTEDGERDEVFNGITNPFFSVDSRDWQVIEPNLAAFEKKGAKLLAIEKERKHVDLERCMMSIRLSDEIIGTQFHPEADPVGMKMYLLQEEKKKAIVDMHGEQKYLDMLNSLDDPARIVLTQSIILPNFLKKAVGNLQKQLSLRTEEMD